MNIIDALMQAGFTRHESMLYITLCREGELTGYEASKVTGIPRSNAYLGLAGLTDKGGAYKIDGETSKFAALEPKELVENLKRNFDQVIKVIEEDTPKIQVSRDAFVTINGKQQIINKMKNLVNHSEHRVYISISKNQLEFIIEELKAAKDRGLKVVIISGDCDEVENITYYKADKQPVSIRLITDSCHVLTGQLNDSNTSTCIYSMNMNMVELIKDSLLNEMKLINIQSKSNMHSN